MPEVDGLPDDVDVASLFSSGAEQLSSGVTLLAFAFCILFLGRPWVTITVSAPSPEEAAETIDGFVTNVLNPTLVARSYPAGASWRAGAC